MGEEVYVAVHTSVLTPPQDFFLQGPDLLHAIITLAYGRLQIPGVHFTNIIQNMVQITPGQVLSTGAFTAPEY